MYYSLKNSWYPLTTTYKPVTFHVITLNTPNYDHIGCFGANSLKKYCDKHKYSFTMYKEKLEPNLHINFTKNRITIETLKNTKADYVVLVDSDIEIVDPEFKLENLVNPDKNTVFYAPKDYFDNDKEKNFSINGGFIIWKNCKRSIEINELWLEKAKNECSKYAKTLFPQQSVYDKCISSYINPNELEYLDHNKVGMRYSTFIKQTKKPVVGWRKAGKPKLLNCNLNTPVNIENIDKLELY